MDNNNQHRTSSVSMTSSFDSFEDVHCIDHDFDHDDDHHEDDHDHDDDHHHDDSGKRFSPAIAAAGHPLEEPPSRWSLRRRSRPVRMLRAMCRALPVLTPRCGGLNPGAFCVAGPAARLSSTPDAFLPHAAASPAGGGGPASSRRHRMTGTLFGFRDARVALSLQENPRCRPTLVVELALPTHALLRELGTTAGARIVLETEKQAADGGADGSARAARGQVALLEEPVWTMFCNGKRVGYAVRREPTDDDVAVLETLWAVSMGGGVIPGRSSDDRSDGEMAYMRGCFDHIVGSRHSESLYMVGPQGGDCPELAIFFVRL